MCKTLSAWLLLSSATVALADDAPMVTISAATLNEQGFLVHKVDSPYQAGTTRIKVLLPDRMTPGREYSVLYVLPVEAGEGTRWGDGLTEVQRADLHNKHNLICAAPTFSHLPWYADHPSDPAIRQETYFTKVVVPFIEQTYPARRQAAGRLLLGFSKSGWGAFSLLLRRPEQFGKAAAWDAPLMMARPNKYGMGPIFGDQATFETYRLSALLVGQAKHLRKHKRLALLGYGNFRSHHQQAHALMKEQQILHDYRDGPQRQHHWNSGWLSEAVELLIATEK